MKVQKLENGQFEVTHNNLMLVQTIINGVRYNDCSIKYPDGCSEIIRGEGSIPLKAAKYNSYRFVNLIFYPLINKARYYYI